MKEGAGFLASTGAKAKNCVLATVRATGRATYLCQDSVRAAYRGAASLASRTSDLLASSVSLLNPFKRRAKPSKAAQPHRQDAQKLRTPPKAPPDEEAGRRAAGPPGGDAPRAVEERKPERERPVVAGPATSSAAVTGEEAEAATFAGAAERVLFRRALSALESPEQAARVGAARTLSRIRHELSVRAIASRFGRESSVSVREACVNALTRLALREGLPVATRALDDHAAAVRLAAVRGVYRLGGPDGAAALTRALDDENEDVRRRAASCMGWLGEKRLARELLPLLADQSASVRSAALEAMANLRSRQVLADVIELLDDPDDSVRRKTRDVLRAITGERMSARFPADKAERQRLIARWRAWWEDQPPLEGAE